jgi:hypothetical protein
MGCGEGDAPCQQVRLLDTRYQSQAACMRAAEAALPANLDADFPVVVAQCKAAGPGIPKLNPGSVKLPAPEATPLFAKSRISR